MLQPIQISCVSSNWRSLVRGELTRIREINLVHFLFFSDIAFCQEMAARYAVEFTSAPRQHVAYFRKKTSPPATKAKTLAKVTGRT